MEKVTYTKEQSSNIAAAEYNPDKKALFLNFHSGGRYLYTDVPTTTWEAFKLAPSKGTYFAENIRNKFHYTRIY